MAKHLSLLKKKSKSKTRKRRCLTNHTSSNHAFKTTCGTKRKMRRKQSGGMWPRLGFSKTSKTPEDRDDKLEINNLKDRVGKLERNNTELTIEITKLQKIVEQMLNIVTGAAKSDLTSLAALPPRTITNPK